jgi:cobalt/nickel transport system permease protein
VIAVSAALLVQALFFGDGGVLAYGANAFNMAFVLPMVGYHLYRALTRGLPATSLKRAAAGGAAAYVAINAAALCAAVELGIQPDLFASPDGSPLYAPFHLSQTVPAMLLAHLTVAGFVEGALTAAVIAYLCRTNPALLQLDRDRATTPPETGETTPVRTRSPWRWAAIGVVVMAVLTPLGLLAPGGAFGESAPADLDLGRWGLQAVPQGLNRYNGFWSHAVLDGYGFGTGQNATLGYLASAVVGIAVIAGGIFAVATVARRMTARRARATRATRLADVAP